MRHFCFWSYLEVGDKRCEKRYLNIEIIWILVRFEGNWILNIEIILIKTDDTLRKELTSWTSQFHESHEDARIIKYGQKLNFFRCKRTRLTSKHIEVIRFILLNSMYLKFMMHIYEDLFIENLILIKSDQH